MARRYIERGAALVLVAVLSSVTTALVMRGLMPPPAGASAGQASEVRASAVVLVGADGGVRARLAVAEEVDVVNLEFFDRAGTLRTIVGQNGIASFRPDGSAFSFVLHAGVAGPSLLMYGEQRLQAVLSEIGLVVNDPDGNQRVVAGDTLVATVGEPPSGNYGIRVRDAGGTTVALLP